MMKNTPDFTWTEKYEEEMSDNNLLDFTQIKNEDFKKIEKTSRKSNKSNKFPPL